MIKNVAILTNFHEFNPGYSLTGIVIDQVRMLLKYGHEVHLFVSEKFKKSLELDLQVYLELPAKEMLRFHLVRTIPDTKLVDYQSSISWSKEHQYVSVITAEVLRDYFIENKVDIVFTHDWIFTGWNLPYAGGIRLCSVCLPKVAWLHWVHSVPSVFRDWWKMQFYGPSHCIVFPNTTDRRRVSDQFRTHENNVMVIPHIKDVRNWYEMSSQTRDFIDANPKLLTAEMIQIYPASSDRLSAKGVEVLIDIWAAWKKHSITGVLVIANQWATGKARKEDIQKYKDMALEKGLEKDEFVFTSEHSHILRNGIPARMLRELQALQNVFIFPTREESFGLVGPEAAMSGCLMVLNSSLDMMKEVFMSRGLFFEFGSFHRTMQYPGDDPSAYLEAVAMTIFNKYLLDPSICAKSIVRQIYNMDTIYQKSYLPVMHNLSITASGSKVDQAKLEENLKAMEVFKQEYAEELEKKEKNDGK